MTSVERRRSLIHRRLCQLLVLAGLVSAVIAVGAAAAPAQASACGADGGVTVVVDFGGGSVDVRCTSAGGSGLAVLHRAGFSTVGTVQYGDGFVCGIDGVPTDVTCPRTPPSNAYWMYSRADSAQSGWGTSSLGATSTSPSDGSFEGWAFGAGRYPSVTPAALAPAAPPAPAPVDTPAPADPTPPPATQEAPAPAAPAPTAGQEAAGSTGGAGQGGGGSAGAGSAPAGGDASTTAASDAPTDAPTDASASASTSTTAANGESSSGSSGSPSIVNASSNEAAPHGGSGSALPTIITLLAVLVIAAGAGAVALRRRGRRASP